MLIAFGIVAIVFCLLGCTIGVIFQVCATADQRKPIPKRKHSKVVDTTDKTK